VAKPELLEKMLIGLDKVRMNAVICCFLEISWLIV